MTQPPKPIISFVHPQAANLHKAFSAGSLLDDVDNSNEEVSDSELNDLFSSKPKPKKRGPPARKELKTSKKIKLDDSLKSDDSAVVSEKFNTKKEDKTNLLRKSGDKKASINLKATKKPEALCIISDSDSEGEVNQILDENSNSKSTEQPAVRNKIKVKPVYVDENTLRQDPSIASSFNALNALRALKSRSQQLATTTSELDTNFDMTSNYSRGNDADPRDILLLIKSTIPDTEARGLLKVRYLRDDNFRKLTEVLSKVFSIDQYMVVVKFDGIALNINDTPRKYGMEDNDVLVASLMDQKPIKTSRELTKSKSGLASSTKTVMPSLEFKDSFDDYDEDAFDLNGSMDENKMKAVEEQIEKELEAKFNAPQQDDETSTHEDKIMLKVVLPAGREPMQFRLAKDAPLSKIIAAVSKSLKVPENKVKLSFDGQVLNPMTTPLDHDMEDEDMLDAVIKKY